VLKNVQKANSKIKLQEYVICVTMFALLVMDHLKQTVRAVDLVDT